MEKTVITIPPDRLEELREVLGKIPGSARLPWRLELFDQRGYLRAAFDLKTGRPIRAEEPRTAGSGPAPG